MLRLLGNDNGGCVLAECVYRSIHGMRIDLPGEVILRVAHADLSRVSQYEHRDLFLSVAERIQLLDAVNGHVATGNVDSPSAARLSSITPFARDRLRYLAAIGRATVPCRFRGWRIQRGFSTHAEIGWNASIGQSSDDRPDIL